MKIEFFVLNCDDHTLRYKKFQKQNGDEVFKRIPCVHYKKVGVKVMCSMLNDKLKNNTSIVAKSSGRRMVEIAISLSHYKMWQEFLKTTSDYCVVLEDDVTLHKDFVVCVHQILKQLNRSFDLLYLWHGLWHVDELLGTKHWDYRQNHRFIPFKKISLTCGGSKKKTQVFKLNGKHTGGTVAYIISRSYAKHLSSKFFPINLPVDDFMGSLPVRRQGKSHAHLMLEMRLGKRVKHHEYSTRQKKSALVDTDLEETTQVMSAAVMDKECSKFPKTRSKAGLAFVKSLMK